MFEGRAMEAMQVQRSDNGDARNLAVHTRELEAENLKALIHGIWHRFSEQHIEMRRSRSGYQIDASTNP
jgi:hypothetical protein